MSLHMSLAEINDIPALANILLETTLETEWGRIQFGAIDFIAWYQCIQEGLTDALVNMDPPASIMKMTDDMTGEVVGFVELTYSETRAKVPKQQVNRSKPLGFNSVAIAAYYSRMIVVRRKVVAEKPYFHVDDLAVKASHRRQGVGSSLMRWAIEYAQSKNGMIYLEATPAGAPLYEKLNFEVKDKFEIDLEPYGGHGTYEEVAMIWQPKGLFGE